MRLSLKRDNDSLGALGSDSPSS
eukprot:COSAG06_NODE_63408_length_262_cov_0.834356_1_plen_22_part_10